MIDFHLIFATSLFIYGLHYLLGSYNRTPLSWLGAFMENNFPMWINKPLFMCPVCQSSIFGTISYWINTPEININTFLLWAVFLVVLSGLNKLLLNFIS